MALSSGENSGCLLALLNLFRGASPEKGPLPYRLKDDFLSATELSFYRVLRMAINDRLTVFCKVRLQDVFHIVAQNKGYNSFFARISQKHVDFLLCDPNTLRPVVAMELDDKSHQREKTRARDRFVDEVFAAASLPLHHFAARHAYSTADLQEVLAQYLASSASTKEAQTSPLAGSTSDTEPPLCPKCGIPLVLRTSSRGGMVGQRFYGCVNYPKCRETIPVR